MPTYCGIRRVGYRRRSGKPPRSCGDMKPTANSPPVQHAIVPTPPIPDHELLRKIGGGSYGEVWLARNVRLGAYRAIKIVRRAAFDRQEPFDREFKGIQNFEPVSRTHEGLVDILQVGGGSDAGYFFDVMERADAAEVAAGFQPAIEPGILPGETSSRNASAPENSTPNPDGKMPLSPAGVDARHYTPKTLHAELKRRGALPLDECLDIALVLTRALAHLHKRGLVHRDIKPSNIIFVEGVPKLADVGLVAPVADARSYVGTEGYIPPEGPGTPQADLYRLGQVLYEMSTGKDRARFPEPPTALASLPDAAQRLEFDTVILKAAHPEARQRYASAEAMLAELSLLQGGKSVKLQRTKAHRLALGKRIGLAAGLAA